MYCYRKVTEDLYWIGANDRRLALFEGVYPIPRGVSYNSYLLLDEKTVVFDTVDKAVSEIYFENIAAVLGERSLDYIVVHHMEPDHAATLAELVLRYPDIKVICNAKIAAMIKQFFDFDIDSRAILMKEGDTFTFGKHTHAFVMAPLVHWPEVMLSYDVTDKILFSADAFGTFGSLHGAIFADEVNFDRDYLDEARRYYINIVGKYGPQVQKTLAKAGTLDIQMICPLHGFVWRKDIGYFLDKYDKWSSYTPEKKGVMIAYASIYGHTANAADILACALREEGVECKVYDASVTHASEIVADAFAYSHLVFAAPTYNSGVFIKMEDLLRDLAAHNLQNRTVAFVENGTWGITAKKQMMSILEGCKNMTYLDEDTVSILSSVKEPQREGLVKLAKSLAASLQG